MATGEQQNVLFDDLLIAPIQELQLWAEGTHTNYSRISAKMRCLTSNLNLSATTKRLLEESYGDSILCQDLCNRYATMIGKRADNLKSTVVGTATIPSQKIKQDHYSLPSSHIPFVRFRDEVNENCRMAILSTYGTFNTITDPILTYTQVCMATFDINSPFYYLLLLLITSFQIDESAMILKRDLQPYYEVIAELLAKSGKLDGDGLFLEPRTDRQIFYIFCALMRIHNQKYFSWWTVMHKNLSLSR